MQIPADTGRKTLCDYLRRGREARQMSLDDISRITRIPQRSLEKLEAGEFEALPADVFVRGFLRSYASCVGLDADEALRRYVACGLPPPPVADVAELRKAQAVLAQGTPAPELLARGSGIKPAQPAPPEVKPQPMPVDDVDESASDFDDDLPTQERNAPEALALVAAETEAEAAKVDEEILRDLPAERPVSIKGKRKRGKKRKGSRRIERAAVAQGASRSRPMAAVAPASEAAGETEVPVEAATGTESATGTETATGAETATATETATGIEMAIEAGTESRSAIEGEADAGDGEGVVVIEARKPRMVMPPRLVIDDADPDVAEQARAERELRDKDLRDESRRTFLPEILREPDQGTRRGTLTLAVIILVIVATLAMSYLLRRPSSSGDGVTVIDAPVSYDRA